ncbi:MAG TPA: preprotein translocase subunit YajC [Gammaproteobacteria bacterium]|jgi:preprotein translocase subunit YajC|nr:preprotein translocase subunit YajC [Gammaproteobacteria bacterium]
MISTEQVLNFFIASAHAADPAPAGAPGGGIMSFLPLIVIFVIFYFLLIRPQSKRAKEHRAMIAALAKGDEVVTGGGLLGRVADLDENYVTLEIAPNVSVKVQRPSVSQVLPKGTLKGG